MSTNSTDNSDPFVAFATPYFNWLENNVFPIFVGVTLIIVLLIGVTLNSILIHAIRRKRLEISSGTVYLINLIILDFVAYFFFLLPSLIVSFVNKWILSDFICILSGTCLTACFLMTFNLQMLIFCERWMKISKPELHEKTFANRKVSIITIITMWIIFLIVGLFPFRGWGALGYISNQQLCNINHTNNKVSMNLLFAFGLYIPAAVSLVLLTLVNIKRDEILRVLNHLQFQVEEINTKMGKIKAKNRTNNNIEIITTRNKDNSDILSVSQIDSMTSNATAVPEIEIISSEIIQDSNTPQSHNNNRKEFLSKNQTGRTNLNSSTVTNLVYDKSIEQMDIHLTITYAIMWGVALVLWTPYIILNYFDVYNVVTVWGGWYSIVVLVTHIVYCIKPIIYLSHNKVFREAAYQTIPESVRTKTNKVGKALKLTMNKVDGFIFLQGSESSALAISDSRQKDGNEMTMFSSYKKTSSITSDVLF